MRQIKFRGWWKDTKEPIPDFMEQYLMEVLDGTPDNPFIYSQWTGLHDKNGKEIYEGDICISPRDEKGIVKFVNAGFWIEYVPPYDWDIMCPGEPVTRELEVIGNIYEGVRDETTVE